MISSLQKAYHPSNEMQMHGDEDAYACPRDIHNMLARITISCPLDEIPK